MSLLLSLTSGLALSSCGEAGYYNPETDMTATIAYNQLPTEIYIGQTTFSLKLNFGDPIQENESIWIYRDSYGLISLGITNNKVSSITRIDG